MELEEMLRGAMSGMGDMGNPDWKVEDLNLVQAGLARKPLADLKPGDLIVQQKWGDDYVSNNRDRPVVFVRNLTEAERIAFNRTDGQKIRNYDIVISYYIDKRDGEVCMFVGNSTDYLRYEHPAEKILREIEAPVAEAVN